MAAAVQRGLGRSSPVKDPQPDEYIYWNKAHVYPNGDLLAVYVAAGDSPWGYGLVRINRIQADLEVPGPGPPRHRRRGRRPIYAVTHEIRRNTYQDFPQLAVPRIDDFAVMLSPDGEGSCKRSRSRTR